MGQPSTLVFLVLGLAALVHSGGADPDVSDPMYCHVCVETSGAVDCNATRDCHSGHTTCMTRIIADEDSWSVEKRCVHPNHCANLRVDNAANCRGGHLQFDDACTFCCDTAGCNRAMPFEENGELVFSEDGRGVINKDDGVNDDDDDDDNDSTYSESYSLDVDVDVQIDDFKPLGLKGLLSKRAQQNSLPKGAAGSKATSKSKSGSSSKKKRRPKPKSPKKSSPKPKSPKKASRKPKSPKKASPKPKSPKKASPKPKSPKKASPKPKSPKKASPKPKSPKKPSPKPKSPKQITSPTPKVTLRPTRQPKVKTTPPPTPTPKVKSTPPPTRTPKVKTPNCNSTPTPRVTLPPPTPTPSVKSTRPPVNTPTVKVTTSQPPVPTATKTILIPRKSTPTQAPKTAKPTPVPTTAAPTGSLCYTCHDVTCQTQSLVRCPADKPLCLTTATQKLSGDRTVSKQCAGESTCAKKWWLRTAGLADCFLLDDSATGAPGMELKECTFCCHGDGCNEHVVPDLSKVYKP